MNVLAIDQGTSWTKARRRRRRAAACSARPPSARCAAARGDGARRAGPAGAARLRRRRAGRRGAAPRRRAGRGRRPGQPGRDRPALGPRRAAGAAPGPRRLAGPARRSRSCDELAGAADAAAGDSPGCRSTRTSRPRRWRGCAASHPGAGVVTTSDAWLVHRLTGAFVTDAATASRTHAARPRRRPTWSAEACDALRARPARSCPSVVDCAGPSARPRRSGRQLPLTGLMVDQQAALLAQCCFEPGRGQVHVRHGRLPARQRRRTAAPRSALTAWSRASPGGSATETTLLPRRPGLHGRLRRALARGAGRRRRRRRRSTRRARRATPAASRSCPRSPASARRSGRGDARGRARRARAGDHRGHLVRALCEGIAAQVAVLVARGGSRPRRAAAQPCASTAASPGRPLLMQTQADLLQRPGRGHRLARRDRARRRARCARLGRGDGGRRRRRPSAPCRRAGGLRAARSSADEAAAAPGAAYRRGRRPLARLRRPVRRRPTTWRSSAPGSSAPRSPASSPASACGSALRRRRRRRRRGHLQGQHRDPAHRLRRQARARSRPGSCAAATTLLTAYAAEAGIPLERTGALLVAWDDEQLAALPGHRATRPRATATTRRGSSAPPSCTRREPHLGPGRAGRARGPRREHRLPVDARRSRSPPRPSLAGVELRRGTRGDRRRPPPRAAAARLRPARRRLRARWVVNAAGLHADEVDRWFGPRRLHGHPAPRRADRLRQARPPAGRPRPAAGADRHDQGRARGADRLRQRDARAHRRGPARQGGHGHRPPPGWPRCARQGARIMPELLERGGDGDLRRAARRDRARRLPARAPTPDGGTSCVGGIRSTGLTRRDGDRRARRATLLEAGGCRCAPRAGGAAAGPDAEHRRGVPAALPAAPS